VKRSPLFKSTLKTNKNVKKQKKEQELEQKEWEDIGARSRMTIEELIEKEVWGAAQKQKKKEKKELDKFIKAAQN